MLTQQEKKTILEIAKKYNISQILLFGSAAYTNEYNDIDLAVKGIKPELFFKFYGEIIMQLSKPVDLIDLNKKNSFVELIKKEGIALHG